MTDVHEPRHQAGSRRVRAASARPRRPWPRVTLAAAAAVSAVLLSLAACSAADGGASPAGLAGHVSSSPAAVAEAVPEYYAETTAARAPAYGSPDNITIRDTDTAAVLATVRPPHPYQTFRTVFAGSRPDTWLAAAQAWRPAYLDNVAQPDTLFTLAFDPATRQTTLTRLPAAPVLGENLAAAALSPGGTRLAEVVVVPGRRVKEPGGFRSAVVYLRLDTMAGTTVTTASRQLAEAGYHGPVGRYSLTWLNDGKTLAVGGVLGSYDAPFSPQAVLYLDTAAPGPGRTVTLSFPPAPKSRSGNAPPVPDACQGPPAATSDGQDIVCGGMAVTYGLDGSNVGFWVFSALTGRLTTTWDSHFLCCALEITMFPRVLWASPTGDTLIVTGVTGANQGASLYVRTSDGHLRQIPWRGLFHRPEVTNITEPAVAW